ncbi:MAG: hypothetical protein ACK5JM_13465 [Rhodoblastus sp.]
MLRLFLLISLCLVNTGYAEAKGKKARGAAAVLVPGAGGVSPADFLVRNQGAFAARGIATTFATSAGEIGSAIEQFRSQGLRVSLVSMSAGTKTAAEALAGGARPDRVVFAAGFLSVSDSGSVPAILGSPGVLPRTLVVHNRNDRCQFTPPGAVPGFVSWARGRARAAWVTSSAAESPPCRPRSPHAFYRADGAAIGPILGFVR